MKDVIITLNLTAFKRDLKAPLKQGDIRGFIESKRKRGGKISFVRWVHMKYVEELIKKHSIPERP